MRHFIHVSIAVSVAAISVLGGLTLADKPSEKDDHNAAMQGIWSLESFTLDGNPVDREQLKNWRRIVKANHVTWKNSDDTMIELDIKFDPTQTPMTLDSTIATGDAKGKVFRAIYELKGDDLRVCFGNPDEPRPKKFSSEAGSGQSIYIAKRVRE